MKKSDKINELLRVNEHFYANDSHNAQGRLAQATKDFSFIESFMNSFDEINDRPRVGDFLKINSNQWARFSYDWGDTFQTGSPIDSYHLGSGYVQYSGSMGDAVPLEFLKQESETKEGRIWSWSNNWSGAHRGVFLKVPFRCYSIKNDDETIEAIRRVINLDQLPVDHPLHVCDADTSQFKSTLIDYYLLRSIGDYSHPLTKDMIKK